MGTKMSTMKRFLKAVHLDTFKYMQFAGVPIWVKYSYSGVNCTIEAQLMSLKHSYVA